MRGVGYSILFSLIIINCSTDTSQPHKDVQFIDNLIFSISDTTSPYTGIVQGYDKDGLMEFSYGVERGEIVGDIQFYNKKVELKSPISSKKLVHRNDIIYLVNEEVPFNGCIIDTYGNGQFRHKYFLINGLQTGIYKSWSINGQTTAKYLSINGNINGEYSEFWENDTLRYLGSYFDNIRIGRHISYHSTGKIDSLVEFDSLGRKDGLVEFNRMDGSKMSKGQYSKGFRLGKFIDWNHDGVIWRERNFNRSGQLNGLTTISLDGKISSQSKHKNGVLLEDNQYLDSEVFFRYKYKNGNKVKTEILPDDPTNILHQIITFENGSELGWTEKHFDTGKLKSRYQVGGRMFLKDGEYYEYRKDGSLWIKGHYSDDSQTGVWVWYDEEGTVTNLENY